MRRARSRTTTSPRRPALAITPTVIATALILAACGSSDKSNSPGVQATPVAQTNQAMIPFADCMRSHRVPNFPDPGSRAPKNAFNTQSPAFKSAYMACQHLQPGGGPPNQRPAHSQAQMAAMLAFARCLRSHGLPDFPDPNSRREITHEMLANAGIDLHQPAVLQAGDACVSVTHGVITKATVARFVAGR
jgi:hypothetical protein